jgi:hypothetical protein
MSLLVPNETSQTAAAALKFGLANSHRDPDHLSSPALESESEAHGVDLTCPVQWAAYLAGVGLGSLALDDVDAVIAAIVAARAARSA